MGRWGMAIGITAVVSAVSAEQGPSPAESASQFGFSGYETLIAESVGDNGDTGEGVHGDDDNFTRFRNHFYFSLRGARFESALRFDATLFHLPPRRVSRRQFVPGGEGYTTLDYRNDFRIEHLHGTFRLGDLDITLGDFHVSLGRGMILSLIKMDDLEEDNQLRGLRLHYRLPRRLEVLLVAGVTNSVNNDPVTRQVYEDDPLDRIVGLRLQWELLDAFSLGAHGAVMRPRYTDIEAISAERRYFDRSPGISLISGGGSLEAHLEGVHFYLEGNGQSYENHRALVDATPVRGSGAAVFSEISYDIADVAFKMEGIYYREWLMEGPLRGVGNPVIGAVPVVYNNLVTLEPRWLALKSMGNEYGGRLGVDVYLRAIEADLSMRVTVIRYLGGLLPDGRWEDHPKTVAAHPTISYQQTFLPEALSLHLSGGARYETTSEPDIPGADSGYLWHVGGDVTVPIRGPHSIAASGEVRQHHLDVTEGNRYLVTQVTLGYRWTERFELSVAHEYSDEVLGEPNRLGNRQWLTPGHYAWALGSLDMEGLVDNMSIRGFLGSQRGGIKCVGGVCRRYPDAVGARLEMTVTF